MRVPACEQSARVVRGEARRGRERVGRVLGPLEREQRGRLSEPSTALPGGAPRARAPRPGGQAPRAPLDAQAARALVLLVQHARLPAPGELADERDEQRVQRARRHVRARVLHERVERLRQRVRVLLRLL